MGFCDGIGRFDLAEKETIPETWKRDITAELRKAFADTSSMIRIPKQLDIRINLLRRVLEGTQ